MRSFLDRKTGELNDYLFRADRDGPCRLPWYWETVRFTIMVCRIFWRNDLFTRSSAMAFISAIAVFPLASLVLLLLPVFFRPIERVMASPRHSAAPPAAAVAPSQSPQHYGTEPGSAEPAALLGEASKHVATTVSGLRDVSQTADSDVVSTGTSESAALAKTTDYETQVSSFLFEVFAPEGHEGTWGENLRRLLTHYEEQAVSVGTIGVIALFTGALALYTSAQQAFNNIWKAKRRRSRVQSMIMFSGMLLWLPLLVFLSLYARNRLMMYSEYFAAKFYLLIPILFTLLIFTFVYRHLPTVEVRVASALLGAVVATILWTVAKHFFASYLMHVRNLRTLVLAIGTIPYLIFWMFVVWQIVLLGVAVSYTHQNYHSLITMELEETVSVIDPLVLLVILYIIGENFEFEGGGVLYNDLRDFCPISQSALNDHLTYLETHNYVCQRAEPDRYILQKPAQRIRLREFLTLAERGEHLFLTDHELKGEFVGFLRKLDATAMTFLSDLSLSELVHSFRRENAARSQTQTQE